MASRPCLSFLSPSLFLSLLLPALLLLHLPGTVKGDCWLIEGDKGYVWLAICSQNQPPYETIPQHINSTVHDLRLNENKLKTVLFTSMYRFTNLTDLNLTKNEIGYIEDGAFAGQANLQVLQLGYNKLTNLTEGMLRGLGRMQCLFLQHNLIEVIATNAFWECPNLSSLDLSSNKLARLDPSTFTVLSRLMVCELAGNPFHCGCELYSFLTWLEEFNNVTHTYDRLQCESPLEMTGYPLLSPVPGHGRNARYILLSLCRDGVIIPGMTSQMPDSDGSGMGLDNPDQGLYQQPTVTSTADPSYNHQISVKLQTVSLNTASLKVHIPRPFSKMYILSQYNHTYVEDIMPLRKNNEVITLDKLKPHTNYTYCVASASKSQRYNHTCLTFTTRAMGPEDHRTNPSTTTHYIMTILGCLFGMVIVLGFVYYCLRRRRIQEEKEKAISVKKTILEMRYGPEAAAAVVNDPGAMQRLQEQAHHQHHHSGGAGGKLPPSVSSSTGMLHGSANTSSSRLSTLPQVEKMATAFSEAMGGKGNYMDVRTTGVTGEVREGIVAAGGPGTGGEVVVDMRGGAENGTEVGDDSDDDGRGSASEISTIAKEVDKVNQIINNCIDALKLDASSNVVTTADNGNSVSSSQPPCIPSLPRNLLPLSPGHPGDQIMASSPKVHPKSHSQPHLQPQPQSHPQPHPQLHQPHPPSMAPVPLVMPLSERPGISGGGFLSPPYRDPPPANAVRPLQRQLSAETAVVKNRCGATAAGSVKGTRVFSVDIPEPRNDPPKYPADKSSPAGCGGGSGSGGGGGGGVGGCNGNGKGNLNGAGVSLNGGGKGCKNANGAGCGVIGPGQQQHHLEVQPDYHSSEHRHSFPALYYEGGNDSPSPAQKASFLKPLGRTKRDATATYSQLSPSRHHNYNSGYSSSPEYSSESTLRIWERFRPYKKSPREEASYIAAGHALRKKVQFAKDEDLHDILDYWKGVSAQQKL
ncbi:protein phosphatase 1 regulatory subunit 29-like [Melanotaenia boesemani]|uniref:protein phosphatase 1 regulatory subunit 29-like n=1 Tax=Melanotaenia boesemani TaxID=1250792 RepID=UPI001C04B3B5|nr:protein phosphatase 1 regulatory subunit 29-like [Melanotaenia boesemani]